MNVNSKVVIAVVAVVIIAVAAAAVIYTSGGKGGTTTYKQSKTVASSTPTSSVSTQISATNTRGESQVCPSKKVTLHGSGSTFVWPAMDAWSADFKKKCPSVTIEYSGGGSGKGQKDIINKLVDFACSDPPLASKFIKEYHGKIIQFPVVLGAVVVTYNLPGIDKPLRLNGTVIAEIYLGRIKYWDDPRIKALNPDIKLPHHEIIAVHRSDASGTTQIFTTFLYKSSKGLWPKSLVGKVVNWPVDKVGRGIGQQGNPGVTEAVKNTPYSIGYIEWAYAIEHHMPVALIENPYGKFVAPSEKAISLAYQIKNPPSPLDDWSNVVTKFIYSNASEDAYPIAGQTFFITWRAQHDAAKCMALKAFIEYIAKEGQNVIPRGYAPLPPVLRDVALKAAQLLECPSTG